MNALGVLMSVVGTCLTLTLAVGPPLYAGRQQMTYGFTSSSTIRTSPTAKGHACKNQVKHSPLPGGLSAVSAEK